MKDLALRYIKRPELAPVAVSCRPVGGVERFGGFVGHPGGSSVDTTSWRYVTTSFRVRTGS